MRTLEWRNDREFTVGGVDFYCPRDDYSAKSTRDRLVLLKDRAVLEQYAAVFGDEPPRTILEFGIFQGGSPALFAVWFEALKVVGIDICDPVQGFDDFRREHAAGNAVRAHYGVSQCDADRIRAIAHAEFAAAPLDVVIDDASHSYKNSRRTFEIAFPLLRPGGTYVIEDWGWAHWPGRFPHYRGQTPLSVLIMELVMTCASRADLITEVRVFPTFAFIRKALAAPALPHFSLDGLYAKGELEIVGTRNLNFGGVARVAGARLKRLLRL